MKIIFLIDSSFSIRDYNRFGFKKLLENGIEVHLWDFYALRNDNFDALGFYYKVNTSPFNMTEIKQNATLIKLKSEDI